MPKKKMVATPELCEWFEEALNRIKKATGARTQVQLAEVLDVRQSSISDGKRRASIPAEWYLKLYRSHGLNPDWIEHGHEPIYLDPSKAKVSTDKLDSLGGSSKGSLSRGLVVPVHLLSGYHHLGENQENNSVDKIIIPKAYNVERLAVLKVDTKAMEPTIPYGSYIGIRPDLVERLDGKIGIIDHNSEGICFGNIYRAGKDRISIKPSHKSYASQIITNSQLQVLRSAEIIWIMTEPVK